MRNFVRRISHSLRRSSRPWLILSLLFVIVVPSLCLLWFMQSAVQNERFAVRQRLIDLYTAQLSVVREQFQHSMESEIDGWEDRAKKISAQQVFAELVGAESADSIAVFGEDGRVVYPDSPTPRMPGRAEWAGEDAQRLEKTDKKAAAAAYARVAAETEESNIRARALQAQARCLFESGAVSEALALVKGPMQAESLRGATDPQGRLIIASAELMALDFLGNGSTEERDALISRLTARLLDYTHTRMTSSQRRFLMREVSTRKPEPRLQPLLAAEDLAQRYVESVAGKPTDSALRPSRLPDVWQTGSRDGTVVLLHRFDHLESRLRSRINLSILPSEVRVQILRPGKEPVGALASIPAGDSLPGWRFALFLENANFASSAADRRTSSYVWIAALMVLVVVLLVTLAWGLVQRQMALSQLRNDLVANVSHELKTPLASMRLLVETLLNSPRLEEKTTREYLSLIATENVRLSRLITNFLTFSRIERNRYTFDFKDVAPQQIVNEAAESVQDRFRTAGCTFEVACAPDLPLVRADADAVVTGLVNLLDNAWKYSGDEKRIRLEVTREESDVRFSVTDNGHGISAVDRKRIFQRFQQAHGGRSPGVAGCGLGLSIVQFIVSAHRGRIELESEVNRGSTFSITLPASRPPL